MTGTGAEHFELDLGPWSVLGNRALSVDDYVPDFDAIAQPPCRMLRIRRAAYRAALEACTLDPVLGYQVLIACLVWCCLKSIIIIRRVV